MTSGLQTIVYPVRDLAAAERVHTALFGEPHTQQPYYVGYAVGEQQVGLDPNGHRAGLTGPVGYWAVPDVEASRQQLLAAGAVDVQTPHDVGGGMLLAVLADADGNQLGLMQRPV
jgi:predicted enzyme related to lactoylglutathione lyase